MTLEEYTDANRRLGVGRMLWSVPDERPRHWSGTRKFLSKKRAVWSAIICDNCSTRARVVVAQGCHEVYIFGWWIWIEMWQSSSSAKVNSSMLDEALRRLLDRELRELDALIQESGGMRARRRLQANLESFGDYLRRVLRDPA